MLSSGNLLQIQIIDLLSGQIGPIIRVVEMWLLKLPYLLLKHAFLVIIYLIMIPIKTVFIAVMILIASMLQSIPIAIILIIVGYLFPPILFLIIILPFGLFLQNWVEMDAEKFIMDTSYLWPSREDS